MDMIPGFGVFEGASVIFEAEVILNAPPESLVLGCDPDFNAVTGEPNPPPNASSLMRTAGGHIHVGGFKTEDLSNPFHFRLCRKLTKYLDEQLGGESNGITYSLFGDGLAQSELIHIAESLNS
jgi:hypothetical protein